MNRLRVWETYKMKDFVGQDYWDNGADMHGEEDPTGQVPEGQYISVGSWPWKAGFAVQLEGQDGEELWVYHGV